MSQVTGYGMCIVGSIPAKPHHRTLYTSSYQSRHRQNYFQYFTHVTKGAFVQSRVKALDVVLGTDYGEMTCNTVLQIGKCALCVRPVK